jgi:hypothetical protein
LRPSERVFHRNSLAQPPLTEILTIDRFSSTAKAKTMTTEIQVTAYKRVSYKILARISDTIRIKNAYTCCIWITTYYQHEMLCRLCPQQPPIIYGLIEIFITRA